MHMCQTMLKELLKSEIAIGCHFLIFIESSMIKNGRFLDSSKFLHIYSPVIPSIII